MRRWWRTQMMLVSSQIRGPNYRRCHRRSTMKRLTILLVLLSAAFFALQSAPAQDDPAKTDPEQVCPTSWCLPGETFNIVLTKQLPDGYHLVSPLDLVSSDGSKTLSASFSANDSPLRIS